MFKVNPDPTFKDDVSVTIPGKKEPGVLSLVFKYKGTKEYEEYLKWAGLGEEVKKKGKTKEKEPEEKDQKPSKVSPVDALMELVEGWVDVDAEFNKESVETLLDKHPLAFYEILGHYAKSRWESRVKN